MQKITHIFFSVLLAGCVSTESIETSMGNMYNVASSGASQFDDTKYIRLSNMVCSNTVMFELYQDTPKAKNGYVLLNAGSKSIDNIGNGESLHLKINDEKYSFKSNDVVTDHETIPVGYGVNMHFSHKSYLIPEAIIRDAAASNIFVAKVNLLNNTYIEGKCSSVTLEEARDNSKHLDLKITQQGVDSSNKFTATAGFKQFVKMMDATIW